MGRGSSVLVLSTAAFGRRCCVLTSRPLGVWLSGAPLLVSLQTCTHEEKMLPVFGSRCGWLGSFPPSLRCTGCFAAAAAAAASLLPPPLSLSLRD